MKNTPCGKWWLSGAVFVCATAGYSAEWPVSTAAELLNAMQNAASGDVVYDKGDDHIIDADRCAVLARYLDTCPTEAPAPDLGIRLEGF